MVELIRKKRDGEKLSQREIESFVLGVKKEEIPDYQISSFLMAVYFSGMDLDETIHLTEYMIETGDKFDLSGLGKPRIDKHSTGGVGDKISLILAPLAAEMGIAVPMISGRGLGHTGGTVDKLESIPGYNPSLEFGRFEKILKETGCSIISQTEKIAPVDRTLYSIRDVTATVESIPLITSSILSKKLSEDLDGLVIDLKVGRGAFMKDLDSARRLGERMKKVGEEMGTRMKIVFTDMSSPIGNGIGNAPEAIEALEVLQGKDISDTVEITTALVNEMCRISGIEPEAEKVLGSKKPLERFKKMVELHGGNLKRLETYPDPFEVNSPSDGIVQGVDAYEIGIASLLTGAGREKKNERVDSKSGLKLLKKRGDAVRSGEPIALIYTQKDIEPVREKVLGAYTIDIKEVEKSSRILDKW